MYFLEKEFLQLLSNDRVVDDGVAMSHHNCAYMTPVQKPVSFREETVPVIASPLVAKVSSPCILLWRGVKGEVKFLLRRNCRKCEDLTSYI